MFDSSDRLIIGNDANITGGIFLGGSAATILQLNSAAMFAANGAVATVLGSVGPVGSHTTVQKWIAIKDNGGTTLYIPAF
jgi:hypothetical protein